MASKAINRAQKAHLQGISRNISRRIRGIVVDSAGDEFKAATEIIEYYIGLEDKIERQLCLVQLARSAVHVNMLNEQLKREDGNNG